LWRAGKLVALRPQATSALRLLVSRRQRLVSQEELRREIWGGLAVEWSAGLHQVMRQLRRALGDDARTPLYIETVPRRGYRWMARAREVPASGPPASGEVRLGARSSRVRAAGIFLAGIATLPIAVLVACLLLACL
jgi:DNA-binding winged helix-turn-helix (wHTH) protein